METRKDRRVEATEGTGHSASPSLGQKRRTEPMAGHRGPPFTQRRSGYLSFNQMSWSTVTGFVIVLPLTVSVTM